MRAGVHVAAEVGGKLGDGPVLLGCLPERAAGGGADENGQIGRLILERRCHKRRSWPVLFV